MTHISIAQRMRQRAATWASSGTAGAGVCRYAKGDGADQPAPAEKFLGVASDVASGVASGVDARHQHVRLVTRFLRIHRGCR
jgi:hypothetical protein